MSHEALPELSPLEETRYQWQSWIAGLGDTGQRRLKAARVLVSRVGGVGGCAAYQLAAAGIGKLVLAHEGAIELSDLNRQLLMTTAGVGSSRVASAEARLKELNPQVEIEAIGENVTETNAHELVGKVDLIVDCAPLYEERFLMNREAVAQRKPLVECSMYALEGQLTTILPGTTPCLACLYSQPPAYWKRQFPVLGAVAGVMGSLAALEAVKLITGAGRPLLGVLLACDLASGEFLRTKIARNPGCAVCSGM